MRSSLDNLSREIARQDKARDDRPPSPGSPGSKPWTDWRGSTSGVRSTANAGGTKADAWGERSRSPETMLPPPASRLSALIEQRAAARQAGQLGSYAADGERDSQRGSGDGPGMEGQQWAWDPRAEATGHGAGMQRGEASYLPRGRASGEQLWDAMGGQEIVEGEGLAPPPFPMVVRPASASSSSAGTQQPGEERLPERYEGPAGAQSTRLQRQASYEPQPPDPFAPMWARGKGSAPAQPWRAKVDPVPGPASAAAAAVTASGGRGDEGQVMELQLQVRSMERRQESLQKTVEQQQEVLRDKDMLLQALQSQLEVRVPLGCAVIWALLRVVCEYACVCAQSVCRWCAIGRPPCMQAAKAKAEQAASGTPRVTGKRCAGLDNDTATRSFVIAIARPCYHHSQHGTCVLTTCIRMSPSQPTHIAPLSVCRPVCGRASLRARRAAVRARHPQRPPGGGGGGGRRQP